jgi:hypothetical protein
MFILTLSLVLSSSFTSATTLVGGKIYNSDFSEVIEGATVTIDCGSDTKSTESLPDGTYAVNFDSAEGCQEGDKIKISASKEGLFGEETSIIRQSEEDGGLVAVANANIKSSSSGSGGSGSRQSHGTWFQCGNTVCDSGESYSTCPKDCPKTENITSITNTSENSSSNPDDSGNLIQENQTNENGNETTNPSITGAVVGDKEKKGNLPVLLAGLTIFLIIAIAGINAVRNKRKRRLGAVTSEVRLQQYPRLS